MNRRTILLALCLVGLPVCGGGGGTAVGDDGDDSGSGDDGGVERPGDDGGVDETGPITLDGPCPAASTIGTFLVEAQQDFSLVDGTVADAVVPVSVLREVAAEGECRLLRRENPFCDPPCSAGQTCDFDGACIPFPVNQDVGVVTVTGLREPVQMQPLQPGNHYFFTDLPNPAFDPGAEIRLRSTQGLALDGLGFVPLRPGDEQWTIAGGRALEVRWDAPAEPEPATRVQLRVDIDQHGNSPLNLVCDLPDTGTASIPASLVDALLDAGISGFPSGRLVRGTTDSMTVADGCVELRVGSPRSVAVRVSGHVPCDDDDACPEDQRCDIATNTCRAR